MASGLGRAACGLTLSALIGLAGQEPGLAQMAHSRVAPIAMTGVQVSRQPDGIAVKLSTTEPPEYRVTLLPAPVRVVIDLEGTYAWQRQPLTAGPPPIREIRGSQWRPGISRVVVELSDPVDYRVEKEPDGLLLPLAAGTPESAGRDPGGGQPVAQASEAPASPRAEAKDWTIKGHVEVGSRHFLNNRDRGLEDDNILLEGEADFTYDLNDFTRLRLRPRLAIDPLENARNRYEPYDAYIEYTTERWALPAGQLLESWAIVDTFNPADVLNRRDLERDFYDPDKLGELMLRFRYFFREGGPLRQPTLSLYLVPLHRETPLPSDRDRFRFDATGDNRGDLASDAVVPSFDIAYAARLSATLGSADVFLFYFGGPGRIPAFEISPLGEVTPIYYRVDMVGGGLQWAVGRWLLKLEMAYTSTRNHGLLGRFARVVPDSYFQYVLGVDRTFTDVLGKNEVTVTLEYAG